MRGAGGVRGAVLACLSALLTGVGHVAGGGTVGDLGLLVVLLPLLAVVFVSLAERSRTRLGTVAVLAAGQLALHYLMVLLHSPADAGPALLGGPSMLAMHAIVTLLSAVGLRHADRAVTAVATAFRRAARRGDPAARSSGGVLIPASPHRTTTIGEPACPAHPCASAPS